MVRTSENGRVWQTNLKPSEPLRWAWDAGSETAVLTISNHCAETVQSVDVTRTENALWGEYAFAVPATPDEQLYTFVLQQFFKRGEDGEKELSCSVAKVAYILGVNGAGTTVRANRKPEMRKSELRAVFAYDAAWASESAAATSAELCWRTESVAEGTLSLSGTSGYDIVSVASGEALSLTLKFDDVPLWLAGIRNGVPGLLLLFR